MDHLVMIADTIVALGLMEVVVKPITVRATKAVLAKLDAKVDFIPDYLHTED